MESSTFANKKILLELHEFRNKLRQSITDAGKGLSAIRCSCEDADKSGAGTLDLRTFETVLANNR